MPVTSVVIVAGCGGAVDRGEMERLRDEVDSSARIMGITVSEALDADLPAGRYLGLGVTSPCIGRPGEIVYRVAATLTHEPVGADAAVERVTDALRAEGYRSRYDAAAGILRVPTGDVDARVQSDERLTGIVVETGCVKVGRRLSDELAAERPRPVRR